MKIPAQIYKQKVHRVKNKENTLRGSFVAFGDWGIQSLSFKMCKTNELEAARKVLNKKMKNLGKVFVRVSSDIPVSKKPKELKLGKGVGKRDHFSTAINTGRIIFEFSQVNEVFAKSLAKLVGDKIGVKTRLVKKYLYLQNA